MVFVKDGNLLRMSRHNGRADYLIRNADRHTRGREIKMYPSNSKQRFKYLIPFKIKDAGSCEIEDSNVTFDILLVETMS